jgi:hypothetical protein
LETDHLSAEEATRLQKLAEKGAFIEFTFRAYTAADMIPLTHYYVEKEYKQYFGGRLTPQIGWVAVAPLMR